MAYTINFILNKKILLIFKQCMYFFFVSFLQNSDLLNIEETNLEEIQEETEKEKNDQQNLNDDGDDGYPQSPDLDAFESLFTEAERVSIISYDFLK